MGLCNTRGNQLACEGGDVASFWAKIRNSAGRLRKAIQLCWRHSRVLGEFRVHILNPGDIDLIVVSENVTTVLLVRLKDALCQGLRLCQKPNQEKVISVPAAANIETTLRRK